MRQFLSALFMVAVSATAVSAQDADWTGAYAGLSMATSTGGHEYSDDSRYDLEGPSFGAYGGYMWGNGNLVYGAEAALTFGGVYEVSTDGIDSYKDEYEYDRFIDLKGRVGYAMKDFLIYGALGISAARFQSDIGSADRATIDTSGMLYGVGADYQFGGRYFVGAEYLRRNFDFYDPAQDVDIDSKIDTFTLRLGMKF